MTSSILPLEASSYQTHQLHAMERVWSETNCYVDLWVELLHALGLDPLASAAFTVSADFEGDQWTFFKFPSEDLRIVYGLEVGELNVWLPVIDHVEEQLKIRRLLTVEVDTWFLPDTRGVSYQLIHQKTTIVPNMLDRASRRLGYFHGPGYFELAGDDFDGIFRLGSFRIEDELPPYVEWIRLDRVQSRGPEELRALALDRLEDHLSRLPTSNPIDRFRERVESDLPWLRQAGMDVFHRYAFGTCRQCGATAELAGSFVSWLAQGSPDAEMLSQIGTRYRHLAESARVLQFSLARMARGKKVDVSNLFAEMAADWDAATSALAVAYGS